MANALPRDAYMRLLYEQAAREQRELAERVRAARGGSDALAADFERWATARPTGAPDPRAAARGLSYQLPRNSAGNCG